MWQPRLCPLCQDDTIIGNGRRLRQAHDDQHDCIWVRHGICRPCRKTFTVLPNWLAPSGHFSVVIDRGAVRKRKKKPSKKFRDTFGRTPLSIEEEIPWNCRCLIVGTGTGALPVMEEVRREAAHRHVKLVIVPTTEAIEELKQQPPSTNAILHVTC